MFTFIVGRWWPNVKEPRRWEFLSLADSVSFFNRFSQKRCQIDQEHILHQIRLSPKVFETSPIYSPPLIPSHLSHSGRNSAKWPFWPATQSGTLDRSRPGALKINRCSSHDFPLSWRCPLLLLGSFLNFFASHLLLFYMFLCVYSPASKRALGSLLVLGLNVLPFVMRFALVVCNVWIKVDITTSSVHIHLFIH